MGMTGLDIRRLPFDDLKQMAREFVTGQYRVADLVFEDSWVRQFINDRATDQRDRIGLILTRPKSWDGVFVIHINDIAQFQTAVDLEIKRAVMTHRQAFLTTT